MCPVRCVTHLSGRTYSPDCRSRLSMDRPPPAIVDHEVAGRRWMAVLRPTRACNPHGASAWHRARHNLSAVTAVNTEVCIGGKDDGIGVSFGHAHEARVGEAH